MNAIEKAIRDLLPTAEQREQYAASIAQREAREARLIAEVRNNCADALSDIGQALRYPKVSASDLECAIRRLSVAITAAQELDRA